MNTNDNIEHIDPRVLKPHPKNSRKHGDSQITQLVASIEQFGFNAVITIDEDDVILAGHGRTLAAIRAGLETVPCLRRTGLTDDQKRAYVIADNKIGLNSEWDEDILAQEIADLTSTGYDLGSLGIDVAALESIADPAGRTAADVKALEEKTDSAPPADEGTFEKEMASKTDAGQLPIVPIYAEHHEAFVIVCDNQIDEAWLRNKLGLEKPMQSYKDVKAQRANVITVSDFRALYEGEGAK